MSKHGVFSGPYFPVFGLNKSPYSVRIQENADQKNPRNSTFFTLTEVQNSDTLSGSQLKIEYYKYCRPINRVFTKRIFFTT